MVAVLWTIITMIQVYKEAVKATMSHEYLVPIRDYIIVCIQWMLEQIAECVQFGNKLTYIKVSIENTKC